MVKSDLAYYFEAISQNIICIEITVFLFMLFIMISLVMKRMLQPIFSYRCFCLQYAAWIYLIKVQVHSCSPSWPSTSYVPEDDFELSPASISQVLGLCLYTTKPQFNLGFKQHLLRVCYMHGHHSLILILNCEKRHRIGLMNLLKYHEMAS